MAWVQAEPQGFKNGRVLYRTNNAKALCAGYCQTWLALSLAGGRAHERSGIMHNEGMIGSIHAGRSGVTGRRDRQFLAPTKGSEASLQANGFKIEGWIQKVWGSWFDSFEELSLQPNGYYYLSIKSPGAHVMACIIEIGSVFYLEPEFGLIRFSTEGRFLEGVSKWYSSKWPSVTNSMMKIYRVSQAPEIP